MIIGRALALALRGHRELVLENLALRQQLMAVKRRTKPHLQTRDRLFWIALARSWCNWRTALVLVQPDTVVRWHRDWLRCRWTRRSTLRSDGRLPIDRQIRVLVKEMATANPLWGAPRIHGELRTLGVDVSEDGVASAATAPTSAFANVEDIPHESPRFGRVDGLLRRADAHRSDTVRLGRAVASPAAHRASQHHGSSDGHVVGSTSGRRLSE